MCVCVDSLIYTGRGHIVEVNPKIFLRKNLKKSMIFPLEKY